MYILGNAIKNIGRNKGRSLLLGAVLLVILSATTAALAIAGSVGGIMAEYKREFGVIVSISPDLDQFMKASKGVAGAQAGKPLVTFPSITPEQYLAYAQSAYLKGSSLLASVSCASDTVKAVDQDKRGNAGVVFKTVGGASAAMPTLKLLCDSNTAELDGFQDGQRKIVDGRLYQGGGECIISRDLADLNGLSVGDAIAVNSVMAQGQPAYRLTIAGIYSDSTPAYGDAPAQDSFQNRRNEILAGFDVVTGHPGASNDTGVSIQAAYYLKSPDLLPEFEAELRAKGLPDTYAVGADEPGYNRAVASVKDLRNISLISLGVLLALGAGVVVLLSSITMRERRQEIGVLRALGMKRGKVALGLLYEMLAISAVCLLAGVLLGSALAQPAANLLLEKRANTAEKTLSLSSGPNFGKVLMQEGRIVVSREGNANPRLADDLKVGLGWSAVLPAALVALLLAAAAGLTAMRCLLRREPPILPAERNRGVKNDSFA